MQKVEGLFNSKARAQTAQIIYSVEKTIIT